MSFDLSRVVDLLYAVCSPGRIERCGFSVPAGKNGLNGGMKKATRIAIKVYLNQYGAVT